MTTNKKHKALRAKMEGKSHTFNLHKWKSHTGSTKCKLIHHLNIIITCSNPPIFKRATRHEVIIIIIMLFTRIKVRDASLIVCSDPHSYICNGRKKKCISLEGRWGEDASLFSDGSVIFKQYICGDSVVSTGSS